MNTTRRSSLKIALHVVVQGMIAFVPMVLSAMLMMAYHYATRIPEPEPPIKTPNPQKGPMFLLGPHEWLVYYDPWFAGTLAPFLWYWCHLLGAWLVAMLVWELRLNGEPGRTAWKWQTCVTLLVGMIGAAPWLYTLFRLFVFATS